MSHPPLGVLNVPFVAGEDVNMDMEDTLPGRWSDIDADIVPIRIEFLVNEFFFLFDEIHAGGHFFWCQVEKTGYMPTRDDDGVPWACRIRVTGAVCKFMLD